MIKIYRNNNIQKYIFDTQKLLYSINIKIVYTVMANNYIPGSTNVWLLCSYLNVDDYTRLRTPVS